jgi:hypothetical protein
MGKSARARKQRREAARRFKGAIDRGWIMPPPPAPPRPSVYPTIALALWAGVATFALLARRWGWL